MKIPRCKGTRDLLPQDMAQLRHIEGVFRDCCLRWGYEEVRTPTLEYLHLFTAAGTLTPDMLGRVYSFLDWDGWSGERVVLRPDGTIPSARLYVESLGQRPVARLFYVENMFTFADPALEARERWQCGAELIGSAELQGDIELILLALEVLKELGLAPVEIRLSHAGLFKGLLSVLSLSPEEESEVLDQLLSGDAAKLSKVRDRFPTLEKPLDLLFKLKGDSLSFVENLKGILKPFPAVTSSIEDLARVVAVLDALGHSHCIDLASVRGFEYYTGIVFQFYSSERKVGGGGRYDELIPLIGGGDVPASGFALYIDELMNLALSQAAQATVGERVLIGAEEGIAEELKGCFELASLLRERGYIVEMDVGGEGKGFRWLLSVSKEGEGLLFHLVDESSGEKLAETSMERILGYMGAGR
jgi:histidyl-tRNA synthetase